MKRVTVSYQVSHEKDANGHMSPDGYSKYNERLKRAWKRDGIETSNNKDVEPLAEGELVYGLEQAQEHIEELKATTGEYAEYWRNQKYVITKVVTEREIVYNEFEEEKEAV